MAKFSEAPFYLLKEYFDNKKYTNNINTARLLGFKTNIIADKSFGIDVYLKTIDGFFKLNLSYVSVNRLYYDYDLFSFILNEIEYIKTGITIDIDGNFVNLNYGNTDQYDHSGLFFYKNNDYIKYSNVIDYDEYVGLELYYKSIKSDISISQILERDYHGCEIYFRKDSPFYNFIKNHQNNGNININQDYIYIGKLDSIDGNKINIKYHGYKDYALISLPPNNRTDYLKTFIETYFDKLYMPDYNLFKNILKMSDPYEVDFKYLGYIASSYDFKLPSIIPEEKQRDFVAALPELLKKKGTYNSLYIIWRVLTNTKNNINIFDRWNTWNKNHTGDFSIDDFKDILYTFNIYNHYKQNNTNVTYIWNDTYNNDYISAIHDTKYDMEFDSNTDTWEIKHNQFQYPFVSFYNIEQDVIYPDYIEYINTTTIVTKFDGITNGKAVILPFENIKHSIVHEQSEPNNTWEIQLGFQCECPLVNILDGNNVVIKPIDIIIDNGLVTISFSNPVSGKAYIGTPIDAYVHYQEIPSDNIIIHHNLKTYSIIASIINNGHVIKPFMLKIISDDIINIIFDEETSCKVFIYTIPDVTLPSVPYKENEFFLSPHFIFEMNLSREPFGQNYIINKELISEIINNIDNIKPVSRFVHYRELISPVTNFSKKEVSLYDNQLSGAYVLSKYIGLKKKELKKETYFHRIYYEGSVWKFNFQSYDKLIFIQCYDHNYNMIIPNNIKITSDITSHSHQVSIDWDGHVVNGHCFTITPHSYYIEDFLNVTNISIDYTYNFPIYPIVHVYNNDGDYIVPKNINLDSTNNKINIDFYGPESGQVFIGDYHDNYYYNISHFDIPSDTWIVNHNLGTNKLIIHCIDENENIIYPSSIKIISSFIVEIKFGKEVAGHVLLYNSGVKEHYNYTREKNKDGIIIEHNANNLYPHVQCYDNDEYIIPNSIEYNNENELTVKIGEKADDITISILPPSVLDKSYYMEKFSNKSTININHSLNFHYKYLDYFMRVPLSHTDELFVTKEEIEFPLVTVIDNENNVVMPNKIKFIDQNNIQIDMGIETSGIVVISMPALYYNILIDEDNVDWDIYNPFYNSDNIAIQILNENNEVIIPAGIKYDYFNNTYDITLSGDESLIGKQICMYSSVKETYVHYEYDNMPFWIIKHKFNSIDHIIECFDFNGNLIPSYIYRDNNTSYAYFDENVKDGYALCYRIDTAVMPH